MLVTSSTTSVAFLANVFSPMMNIKAFGIFSGLIVPVNYILVVLIFPPAVILYDRHYTRKGCCCSRWACCCWKKNLCCGRKIEEPSENFEDTQIEVKMKNGAPPEKDEVGIIEAFFGGPWNNTVKVLRWPIIVLTLIWFQYAAA